VAGPFFGIAFGVGGIGAALLGRVADRWGIERAAGAKSAGHAHGERHQRSGFSVGRISQRYAR
jgi:hypothetical protein